MINLITAAALIVAGFFLASLLIPVVLASLAVLGALYEESVTFDRAKNRVEFKVGLVVFHRTKAFALEEVSVVRTTVFGPAQFVGLEIGLRDGTMMTIENDRGKASKERLTGWGQDLSQWLGVPLEATS